MKYDEMLRRVKRIGELKTAIVQVERRLSDEGEVSLVAFNYGVDYTWLDLGPNATGDMVTLRDRLIPVVSDAIVHQIADWQREIEEFEKDA